MNSMNRKYKIELDEMQLFTLTALLGSLSTSDKKDAINSCIENGYRKGYVLKAVEYLNLGRDGLSSLYHNLNIISESAVELVKLTKKINTITDLRLREEMANLLLVLGENPL